MLHVQPFSEQCPDSLQYGLSSRNMQAKIRTCACHANTPDDMQQQCDSSSVLTLLETAAFSLKSNQTSPVSPRSDNSCGGLDDDSSSQVPWKSLK